MAGRPTSNEKLVWVLVVVLAGWLGALIYYIVVMRKYPRQRGVPGPPPGPPGPPPGVA